VIGKIKGLEDQYISRFIAVFAKFLSLKGNEQVLMGELSVNERKKVNIMAAFLGFPKVIILDETSTGLDSDTSQRILHLLKIYSNQYSNCVLLTSHNIPEG
jgi:ABC-2 type transport system ATP-binding protein